MSQYGSTIDLKLDFFLFYAEDKSLAEFQKEFSKTKMHQYSDYAAAPIGKWRYDKYIEWTGMIYYPINKCRFSTVFDGLDDVFKNRKTLSREGILLWLLFYYHKDVEDKDCYSLEDINGLIQKRYAMLNEDDYFDNFLITVLKFKLENGKIMYGNEEIEKTDTLNTENIHELRHNIIRLFELNFNPDFAADSFIDTSNSTTSLSFKSIKKRLGLE